MSNYTEHAQRMLGDTSRQFTVTSLSSDEERVLRRYVDKSLNSNLPHDQGNYALYHESHYALGDSMTGERYFVGAAVQRDAGPLDLSSERTANLAPIIVQVKGGEIVNTHKTGNKAALEKLGITEADMPNVQRTPLVQRGSNGRGQTIYDVSEKLVNTRRLAGLIDEGLAVGLDNQKPLNTVAADSRQKLRGQVLLEEKLADEHESLMTEVGHEDIGPNSTGRPIASKLYQNTFEPEGYTLDKNNELVAPADSKRIQNATYSALAAGRFMNLNDTNDEYLLGKPGILLQSFIGELAEQNNEGVVIGATVIKHKSSGDQTVLYGLSKPELGTGFFNAVTIDSNDMVIAKGSDAMAGVGVKFENLNQGQLWSRSGVSHDVESIDVITQQQQFMAQINADNLRRAVSKSQIAQYKQSIGQFPDINTFDAIMDIEKQGIQPQHILDGGEKRSNPNLVEKLKSELVAARTFNDRFTLTSIEYDHELEALHKIISVNSDIYEENDGVENRQIVGAIKMQEHWSDNSSEVANPGKVDKVRMLVQIRSDMANASSDDGSVSSKFSTTVHTFDDGVYTGSYKPESDPEMGMRLDRAISNYADGGRMRLNQQAVFDSVLDSFNVVERNNDSIIKLKAENGIESYKEAAVELAKIDTVAEGESEKEAYERDFYEREEGYHLAEKAEWEREQQANEESSRLAERIFDDFNPYEPGWQEQIAQADADAAAAAESQAAPNRRRPGK